MEKKLLNAPNSTEKATFSLMAEMVLDKALLDYKINKLREKIDESLMSGNKEEFMRLSEEFKKIS